MRNYINVEYPKSNEKPDIKYHVLLEGGKILTAKTFDDLETIIQQAQWNKQHIKKAVKMDHGLPIEFKPETRQERTDRENFEHCKRICEELEAYAEGHVYKCPDCGEVIHIPDNVGDKFKCPNCGEVYECDLDLLTLYDYFEDILDIDYIVNYRKEYRACRILVAFGGPNIYIDTFTGCVELYWWSDRSKYQMLSSTIDAVNDWAEEYYNCL